MEPDYEAIELKVENDMVKTEMEPTPRSFWLSETDGYYTTNEGKCCILSPQLIGEPCSSTEPFAQISEILGVNRQWVFDVIGGFDGQDFNSDSGPGHAFGAEMRRKYVTDPAAAQEAADARRDREEDR